MWHEQSTAHATEQLALWQACPVKFYIIIFVSLCSRLGAAPLKQQLNNLHQYARDLTDHRAFGIFIFPKNNALRLKIENLNLELKSS